MQPMARPNEYADKAAQNEALLRTAIEWLFADAEARTRLGVFGRQVLEVNWENGAIQVINIDQRNTLRRGKPGAPPDTTVLTPDGAKIE